MTLSSPIISRIDQLSQEYPLRSILNVPKLRPSFWKLVFANGWNTALPDSRPPAFGPLSEHEYKGLPVGNYMASRPITQTPGRSKRVRQPAFLKVEFRENGEQLVFPWVSESSSVIREEDVKYNEDTTLAELRVEVVNDWDEKEISGVSEWNARMIAFWGRQRLVRLVGSHSIYAAAALGRADYERRKTIGGGEENLAHLQNSRLCRRILQLMIKSKRLAIGRIGKDARQSPRVNNLYGRRYVYSRLHEDDVHLERLREMKELLEKASIKDLWFIW